MATQDPLLDPLPTNTVTGVGTLTSPDDFDRNAFVFTDDTKKDLVSYFNSKEGHPIANLTKNQKDAAVSGFRDFVKVTAQSNADPGMVLPEKFEIPAYSEYNGPIIEAQFPAVNTPDDLINFGMVDENGPTDKGSLMIDLKKIGGLNRDYTLNLTGKALLSDQEESLKPENLPIFMERQRLKLDEPEEKSWGTIWDEFSGVLKSTLDTFTAINPLVNLGVALTQDDKTKAMFDARRNAMIEAGVSGVVKFENTLASGASTIAKGLLARAVTEGKQQDVVLAALDQNFKRTQFQQQAFKSSEALHEIFGLTNWVDQMANAKEQLGEAGFQKAQETGEVGGQMLFSIINPLAPENVAFNMGMKLTMAPFKVAGAMVGTARVTAEKFAEASNNLEAININLAKTQAAGAAATKYSASLQTAAERLTAEGNIAAAKSVGKQIVKSNNIAQKAVFQAEQWTKLAGEASQKVDFLAPSASRANGIIKVADIAAQFPKLITTPVGFTLQKVGRGMIKIDAGLEAASQKMGAGKLYNAMTKWSSMAGIGTFGAVSGLPPSMAWFPAAFKLAWSTAPVIEAAGDFVRVVGREASAARGAIPMWRKIGRMQNAGPAHRMVAGFMDVATLGGFPVVQNAVKGGIAATVATVPVDLAFRYVSSGGETTPNTLKESIVGTAFFAGGGASLGAIHMGSKGTLKKLQMGDVLNFRRSIAEPQQRMMFDAMPRGYRDAIGSYSSSKPNTPIEFVKEGGGNYDPSTNTIRINPNAKNPLRPLIGHEILESLVVQSNMGEAIRTMLVGDGVQTGGLLRDRNGNLDPKFIEFRDRYNQLRQAEVNRINQTRPPENRESFTPLNDRDMAKEYFIEMNADDMAGLAESGQLGKFAARSAASRKMIDLGNTILNKSSILRNLHFNLGGVMDSGGKMVMGNGLLADGIRQLPEAKAMFQKMVRDTAGRPNVVKMTAEKSKGSVIPTSGMDDPLWSDMTAYWKTDQAGVPIKDKSGNWVPLERHVEQAREQAGLLIQADQKQRIAAGETIPKHEIQYSPETGWRGKYFSAAQIEIIKNSGYFNDSQIRLFEHVNNAAKRGKGERFLMIYNPATSSRLRGRGSKRYETLGPTMKEGGVLGFSMGQKGQLLIDIIDTQQLHQNVMEQAGKKIGQKLYKGNIDKILTDINAVMELHGKGESADIHFKQEYGVDWKAHKDFINSTFGDISGGAKARPADYMMINPVLVTDRPTNAVFKTYRLDRLNKATAMEGTTGIPMDYNMVKANFMPDGVPLFTGDGEPVDLRYTAVEDENGLRAVPGANYGKKNGMPVEDAGGMPVEQTAPVIKSDEKLWDSPPQNITSADTSINDKKTAATFTKVNFEEGTINADIGGGRFDNATSILKDKGITNIIFDPFNRTEAHNTDAANKIKDGQADTTTVNNVLNVIQEAGNRDKVIRQAANAVKPNGTSYFLLYEGNGSGVGRETSKGWQENRKTKDYLNEIGAHYDDVKVKNGIIEAKNPIKNISPESAAAYEKRRDALKSSGINARDRNVTKAVNINDSSQDFTGQIIRGEKTIETRDTINNALHPLRGQRVGLVSTGVGDTKIVGYATVGDQPIVYNTEAEFRKDQGKHLVPQGSKYDIKQGQKKYGYELKDVVAVEPFSPKSTNRKYSVIDPSTLNRLPEPLKQMPQPGNSTITEGIVDPSTLNFREKMQNNTRSVEDLFDKAENDPDYIPPIVVSSNLDIIDGHNRATVAIKRGISLRAHFVPSDLVKKAEIDGYDAPEIAAAAADYLGNYERVGQINQDFSGSGLMKKAETLSIEWSENKPSTLNRLPEPAVGKQYMPEVVDPEDKGIQAPLGSLGELRKNVEIKKFDLPDDTESMPKFVAREGKDEKWKIMEGPVRVSRGNYLTPLPNIKVIKTKQFAVQNQGLIQNAFLAKSTKLTTPKELRDQQNAIRNTEDALVKIESAIKEIETDPEKFVNPKGYAETMKKAGVTGDVLIPPSSLKTMLKDPDAFAALLSGGYHGDKTVAGIRDSAMSGLDSVVEMRQLIGGRPPELITAIHHLWGTLSKQLPPLQQEALWMRMITNKEVMTQIGESINGTYSQSPDQWENVVKNARSKTVGDYGKLGNNATANANSFYLMLSKHNGKWGEVSDVYKYDDPVKMRYAFNALGHGATGIKNKVQSFIGLTFGIKGNVLDRWRFVDMYLDDAMKITGAKNAREYFKYEGKNKDVPVDKIGIYKNYGTIENKSPLFSLALYSAMDRVSQSAINASPALKTLLGNHADPGGLHWLSWNAIKNEAVGHSSLDITKNFIKKNTENNKIGDLTIDKFLNFVNSTEAFVEGTSGGDQITRLTLKNGVFSLTKK